MAAFIRVKQTAKRVFAPVLLLLMAVLFVGAAFQPVFQSLVPPPSGFWEPVQFIGQRTVVPVEKYSGLERLEALVFSERAIAVSA